MLIAIYLYLYGDYDVYHGESGRNLAVYRQ